jgi:nucleoside-diphosphate-sugar epimerase
MPTEQEMAIVTGAAGWLGQRIVRSLVHGLERTPGFEPSERRVRALVLPGTNASALRALGPNVEVAEGDVADAGSLAKLFGSARGATVFHAAGVIHPPGRTRELYRVNVDGTKNMLDAARAAGVRRFVHVSSNSPIGTNPRHDHVFDETAPYDPYMKYGKTKMLAEELVTEAGRRGDLETVIIRPPWFYGPGQPPRQTLFFEMIRDGKAPIVGGGENRRSMAYVDNICQGLLLCERTPAAAGQIYWIADARPYSMNEIVDTVERVLERDFAVTCKHGRLRLPGVASDVARLIDATLQAVGLYHQKIHVLSEMNQTIACSIAKAERELGYAPSVDLELGMKLSLEWLFANGGKL